MQKKTNHGQKYLVAAVSLALLSACGGGENKFVNADEAGSLLGPAHKPLDPPIDTERPVTVFLVNEIEGTKNDLTLSKVGQQNSPAVAVVDTDNTMTYSSGDRVGYDQVAILSSACIVKECGSPAEAMKARIANAVAEIDERISALSSASGGTGGGTSSGTGPTQDQQAQIATLNAEKRRLQSILPGDDYYASVDVNGHLNLFGLITIDDKNTGIKRALNDAGVSKIDMEKVNGELVPDGGTVLRRFNGIMPLTDLTGELDGDTVKRRAYFRSPTVAGWSYQTFLHYYSTARENGLHVNRDLLQGYQSIGFPTLEMPDRNWADYEGISHALYNGNQVTMENKIHANFASRNLDYRTVGTPILHTFENGQHIIEKRPDMSLSGSASWAKGKAQFKGDIRAANGLQGRLEGQFYGLQAAEVGGVFGMEGNIDGYSVDYIGGFGAKR